MQLEHFCTVKVSITAIIKFSCIYLIFSTPFLGHMPTLPLYSRPSGTLDQLERIRVSTIAPGVTHCEECDGHGIGFFFLPRYALGIRGFFFMSSRAVLYLSFAFLVYGFTLQAYFLHIVLFMYVRYYFLAPFVSCKIRLVQIGIHISKMDN